VDPAEHALRVDAPARLHGDVLNAADFERRWHARDARARAELPKMLARRRVERVEVAVRRATLEHDTARGREHGAPVRRRVLVRPRALAGLHVPRLELADVRRAGCD